MEGRACENGTQSPDKTAKVCKKKKQVKKKAICCCHFLHFPFIHNFHIDHNVSCLPPALQICKTIISNFFWVLQSSQEKSKRMVMQNFRG